MKDDRQQTYAQRLPILNVPSTDLCLYIYIALEEYRICVDIFFRCHLSNWPWLLNFETHLESRYCYDLVCVVDLSCSFRGKGLRDFNDIVDMTHLVITVGINNDCKVLLCSTTIDFTMPDVCFHAILEQEHVEIPSLSTCSYTILPVQPCHRFSRNNVNNLPFVFEVPSQPHLRHCHLVRPVISLFRPRGEIVCHLEDVQCLRGPGVLIGHVEVFEYMIFVLFDPFNTLPEITTYSSWTPTNLQESFHS